MSNRYDMDFKKFKAIIKKFGPDVQYEMIEKDYCFVINEEEYYVLNEEETYKKATEYTKDVFLDCYTLEEFINWTITKQCKFFDFLSLDFIESIEEDMGVQIEELDKHEIAQYIYSFNCFDMDEVADWVFDIDGASILSSEGEFFEYNGISIIKT